MIDKTSALIKIAQRGHYGRIDIPPSMRGQFDGAAFMSGYVPDKNTNQMIDVESDKRRSPKINFDSNAWRNLSRGLKNNTNRLPFGHYPIQSAAPSGPVKWPEWLNDYRYIEGRKRRREQKYNDWIESNRNRKRGWTPPNTWIDDERWTTTHPMRVNL